MVSVQLYRPYVFQFFVFEKKLWCVKEIEYKKKIQRCSLQRLIKDINNKDSRLEEQF